MRILMGAQNCGFGPASALVAISRLLAGHDRVFVGDGVAAVFAGRNAEAFDGIRPVAGPAVRDAVLGELLARSDLVVSVMDADLAVRAAVARRPVVMVDCLFGFWRLRRPLAAIRERCASLPRSSFAAAEGHLAGLSPHERVVAAHLLAEHSLVQNFPGVPRRVAEFAQFGGGPRLHLTGPIVDVGAPRGVPPREAEQACDLLVNVGGFRNFFLDFDVNNGYLRLLERWLPDLLRDWPRFPRVLVCGGPFGGRRERTVTAAGRRARCRLLPQRDLVRQVASAPAYVMAPGLSALHESLALGRLPLGLHEQHYAHVFTVRGLGATLFGRAAGRFADVLPDCRIPEDDVAGTVALAGIADRVGADDELYARFRRTWNERLEAHLALTPAQRRRGVAELRDVLGGEPVAAVLPRVLDATGAAGRAGA